MLTLPFRHYPFRFDGYNLSPNGPAVKRALSTTSPHCEHPFSEGKGKRFSAILQIFFATHHHPPPLPSKREEEIA